MGAARYNMRCGHSNMTLKRRKESVCRKIGGEYVLVPVKQKITNKGSLYIINETGSAIWEMLDGKRDVRAIARALADKTNTNFETVLKDADRFLKDLLQEKLAEKA
jgi:hypothetical protein